MKVQLLNRAISQKQKNRLKRKLRIRKHINGTAECPRVSFFRSNKNIYVQVIDDVLSKTLLSVSTYEEQFRAMKHPTIETAKGLGTELAKRLKEHNIHTVVFDRNGYKYHGVAKSLVDSMRENEIKV